MFMINIGFDDSCLDGKNCSLKFVMIKKGLKKHFISNCVLLNILLSDKENVYEWNLIHICRKLCYLAEYVVSK